jgi:site-specific DNA recombinase
VLGKADAVKTKETPMRAAIHARCSSGLQRDASIEDQARVCPRRIEHEGWTAAQVYSDHGMSGASLLRPACQRMLDEARAGRFDAVIAESIDRLTRDQEHIAALFKQLSFQEIPLLTAPKAWCPISLSGSKAP